MNYNFIKKIMIGTAQFGSEYGVSNKKKISKNQIKKIFYFLEKKKFKNLILLKIMGMQN